MSAVSDSSASSKLPSPPGIGEGSLSHGPEVSGGILNPLPPEHLLEGEAASQLPLASTIGIELSADEKGLPFSQKAYRWNQGRYSRQRRFVDIWGFMDPA